MSHVVISSFENVATGDLQSQGESVAVFESEVAARAHLARRSAILQSAVGIARAADPKATFITWLLLLRMPLAVDGVEEALEDLELILEETESIEDPFGELVVDYEGSRHEPAGNFDYACADALRDLEAWLS
ncbi:hypothetical protein [Dokdonella immobilis]|uniref:Uncharacterized protein n=1 Tax=Dokdonella immobilis TaxID=578942 RepID=A0A1I4XQ66_9GAMM|nr:hypothetical protein [Dokdonella immobilis]SFN28018.1 hypothetical protein SAMN05216289_11150 [Dokdonella immobilis]